LSRFDLLSLLKNLRKYLLARMRANLPSVAPLAPTIAKASWFMAGSRAENETSATQVGGIRIGAVLRINISKKTPMYESSPKTAKMSSTD
jgi:hypothetical protein